MTRDLVDSGARGYVMKSDASHDLVNAVEALRSNRTYFTKNVSDVVLRDFRNRGERREESPERGPRSQLTPREREVVQLLGEGKSNKEVAQKLNISVKTAETHRSRIMTKLNLRS